MSEYKKATMTIHKDYKISKIDKRMYGSFVEPLGRCIYNGIFEPGHPEADEKGFRRDVLRVIEPLHIPIIRFPGGNFVASYRWEDGVGPVDKRPTRLELAWQSIEPNRFGTNEMVEWSRLNGSDIMMTVNLGTRGIEDALNLLEYCNFPKGTYYSDLRISHGYPEPHNIKTWALTNEADGDWQVGQKTPIEYARLARETGKAMKLIDPELELVLCGSSAYSQKTFPEWDATALEHAYPYVDYLSIHTYYGNNKNDTPNFLAKTMEMEKFITSAIATCDYIKAKHRTDKTIYISLDEWNVWHTITAEERFKKRWQFAPPLLEDVYTMEDAVMLGSMMITMLRHSDRIKIGGWSELVNCISSIRTENGGPVWCLPPYYTFLHTAQYGQGEALLPVIDSPVYDSKDFCDVPVLDAIATLSEDENLTIFAVNKDPEMPLQLECDIRSFEGYRVKEHIVFANKDIKATNTKDNPANVVPHSGGNAAVTDGRVTASLPAISWNVIRLAKA